MKKSGMTLVEIIVSLALTSIIVVSIITTITALTKGLNANAGSILANNEAKGKLEIATNDHEFTDANVTIQENRPVNVLGKEVNTTYITSIIEDPTGFGGEQEYYFIYDTDRSLPTSVDEPEDNIVLEPFWDYNRDGILNGEDYTVNILSSTYSGVHTYTNMIETGNLVFRQGEVYYNQMSNINIGSENDIVFQEGARLTIADITMNNKISCRNFIMNDAQIMVTEHLLGKSGMLNIYAYEDIILNNSAIYSFYRILLGANAENESGELVTKNIKIENGSIVSSERSGVSISADEVILTGNADNITQIRTSRESESGRTDRIQIHANQIQFGDKEINSSKSYVEFSSYETDELLDVARNGTRAPFTENSVDVKLYEDGYFFKQ